MELKKYYSLDECSKIEEVFSILNRLQDDEKIDYESIDDDIHGSVIKIKDIDMSINDIKELMEDFNDLDVIDFPDYDYSIDDLDEDEDEVDDEFDDFHSSDHH